MLPNKEESRYSKLLSSSLASMAQLVSNYITKEGLVAVARLLTSTSAFIKISLANSNTNAPFGMGLLAFTLHPIWHA